MIRSYGKMSNGELAAHEENVVSFLRADERFCDCEEDAEDLGVSLSVSVCRSHADPPPAEGEEKFSPGYESDLRVDFVSDGYVMMNRPEEGRALQMSVSVPLVKAVDSLFIRRLELVSYDELTEDETFFFAVEDFLDEIEDRGVGIASPFCANENEREEPEGPFSPMASEEKGELSDLIEWQIGEFDGLFDKDDSLYLTRDGFYPFRVLLAHVLGDRYRNGGVWRLSEEDCRAFLDLVSGIVDLPDAVSTFSDLLSELSVYEFAPTDRAERLLTAVTLSRREEFLSDAGAVADWISERLDAGETVTVVDF